MSSLVVHGPAPAGGGRAPHVKADRRAAAGRKRRGEPASDGGGLPASEAPATAGGGLDDAGDRDTLLAEPMVECALRHAGLGRRVLPLEPGGKGPCGRLVPRGVHDATTDAGRIRAWWEAEPAANVGVAMGGGLVGVDEDPRNGGDVSLGAAVAENGPLPGTLTTVTPGGGHHYVFACDASLKIGCRTGLWRGVDIKGEGGYLVGAGSVLETGRVYEGDLDTPVADAPGWLLGELAGAPARVKQADGTPTRSKRVRGRGASTKVAGLRLRPGERRVAAEMIRSFPVEGPGLRHAAMNKVVGWLFSCGYGDDAIRRVHGAWHRHFFKKGLARTGEEEARRELELCLTSARRLWTRGPARSVDRAMAVEIGGALEALRPRVPPGRMMRKRKGKEEKETNCQSLLIIGDLLCQGLPVCHSWVESLVVEAWLRYAIAKLAAGEDPVRMIDLDVIEVANRLREIRCPAEAPVGEFMFYRVKAKFVDRADRPASRCGLLEVVVKGERAAGGEPGTPSVYRVTGLADLMALVPVIDATGRATGKAAVGEQAGAESEPAAPGPRCPTPRRGRGRLRQGTPLSAARPQLPITTRPLERNRRPRHVAPEDHDADRSETVRKGDHRPCHPGHDRPREHGQPDTRQPGYEFWDRPPDR